MKKQLLLIMISIGFLPYAQAQNVGIGLNNPTAKLHVDQTAGIEAILVDHTGAAGNSAHLFPSNAANASSTLWIENSTVGAGINTQMLTATSTASSIISTNLGTGIGVDIWQANATGTTASAININQDGTDPLSRGVDIYMDAANGAIGYSLFHSGTGRGFYIDLSNATSIATGTALYHAGGGTGSYIELSNGASNASALAISHATAGTGRGINLSMSDANSTGLGAGIFMSGLGRGGNISLSNAASTAIGWAVFTAGTGSAVYGQSLGDGVFGISTGITGTGGVFLNNNPAADRNASGLFVSYGGTGGGTAGAGNSAEFQHFGDNGNAVDIFLGDPSTAPGPANTTSEYTGLSVSHMATGTSLTPGLNKTAISASNYSADPAVLVFNNGNATGSGLESYVVPGGTNDPISLLGTSYDALNTGYGIGVRGDAGWYGVQGRIVGAPAPWAFAMYGSGDYGGTGVKYFSIDHPLDPENKILNHYSIESNEVTNMYRGIIMLDANGQAVVDLPSYFDAANIDPSYQLTAIGTPVQPYIAVEEANNQFTVAGAPNTKVSWTVYAKRNDPTIRYFDSNGKNYDQEEVVKPTKMQGKYYTPEAYGKDKTQGIHYRADIEKTLSEREAFAKNQKAMSLETKKISSDLKSKESSNSKEKNKAKDIQPKTNNQSRGEEVTINK